MYVVEIDFLIDDTVCEKIGSRAVEDPVFRFKVPDDEKNSWVKMGRKGISEIQRHSKYGAKDNLRRTRLSRSFSKP